MSITKVRVKIRWKVTEKTKYYDGGQVNFQAENVHVKVRMVSKGLKREVRLT